MAARVRQLSESGKDKMLEDLESGELKLEGVDGKAFFTKCVKDMQKGFFADPIYGGNRDMVAWKMIGFPGARYDYLDWVGRHNERYPCRPSASRAALNGRRKRGEVSHGNADCPRRMSSSSVSAGPDRSWPMS